MFSFRKPDIDPASRFLVIDHPVWACLCVCSSCTHRWTHVEMLGGSPDSSWTKEEDLAIMMQAEHRGGREWVKVRVRVRCVLPAEILRLELQHAAVDTRKRSSLSRVGCMARAFVGTARANGMFEKICWVLSHATARKAWIRGRLAWARTFRGATKTAKTGINLSHLSFSPPSVQRQKG